MEIKEQFQNNRSFKNCYLHKNAYYFFEKINFVLSTLLQRKPIILRTPLNSSDRELVTLSECSLDSNVFKGSQGSVFSLQNTRPKMMFIFSYILSKKFWKSLKLFGILIRFIKSNINPFWIYIQKHTVDSN